MHLKKRKFLKLVFVFMLIQIPAVIMAQTSHHEFKQISSEQYEMSAYEPDPDAEAVILHDIGTSKFVEEKGTLVIKFNRRKRIKIFTEAGKKYAEIEIPFYRSKDIFEKVNDIEAYTYNYENEEVKITQLEESQIFEEKVNDNWYIKKFAMPNVKAGSIIEIRYTHTTPYKFHLHDWEFQSRIPTIYSKYSCKFTPFYKYTYRLQGADESVIQTPQRDHLETTFAGASYRAVTQDFIMENVPAFKDESMITSINDYIKKVDFQLSDFQTPSGTKHSIVQTWRELNDELLTNENFGKYLKKTRRKTSDITENITQDLVSETDRLKAIVNYVKENYRWNGMYGIYAQKDIKDFMKEKSGNIGNINLFLTALLQNAGFDAHPVILSTRKHGKIYPDFPFVNSFNYTTASIKINNTDFLPDATDLHSPYLLLPPRCINGRALQIKDNEVNWLNLSMAVPSETTTVFTVILSENADTANIQARVSATAYEAVQKRKEFADYPDSISKYYKEKGLEITDKASISGYENPEKPYTYSFKAQTKTNAIQDDIYLSPFLNEPLSENPFKYSERNYPIDMIYPKKKTFNATIYVPDNYEIKKIPENYSNEDDLVKILYLANQFNEGKIIQVTGSYAFKKGVYSKDDYLSLKLYYDKIIEVFNDNLILTKK